ncbi:hypothetical protein [Agromyces aerolatus]|uniref:hypothetical protein n=1 Tax=Agromyces sp. LY-1074 TaxID=3074080 RepID=UPI00285C2C48|nr:MULTISPECIES: hypothetical protein [unclassified Agromyces]MDR5698430.1 hypothetical protein [Agromyces sp. LY-1074]MDR5704724.1 hypothetical protein [Agromyces sp. LY-1358]
MLGLVSVGALTGCASAVPAPTAPPGVDLESFDGVDGNGLWLLPGAEARTEILDAMRAGGPVKVTGSFTELVQPDPESDPVRGRTITVDFHGRADAFTANVVAGDQQLHVVLDDGTTHVRGNAAYAESIAAPDLADRVTCTVGSDPTLERWSPLFSPAALVEDVLAHVELGVAPPAGDGETLEVVVGTEGSPFGVLTVERYGAPLPRGFTAADASGDATFAFAEWGVAPDLAAAAAALPCP